MPLYKGNSLINNLSVNTTKTVVQETEQPDLTGTVMYTVEQGLTDTEKQRVQKNIGVDQLNKSLTDKDNELDEKIQNLNETIRQPLEKIPNIEHAIDENSNNILDIQNDIVNLNQNIETELSDVLRYSNQELTPEQLEQVYNNLQLSSSGKEEFNGETVSVIAQKNLQKDELVYLVKNEKYIKDFVESDTLETNCNSLYVDPTGRNILMGEDSIYSGLLNLYQIKDNELIKTQNDELSDMKPITTRRVAFTDDGKMMAVVCASNTESRRQIELYCLNNNIATKIDSISVGMWSGVTGTEDKVDFSTVPFTFNQDGSLFAIGNRVYKIKNYKFVWGSGCSWGSYVNFGKDNVNLKASNIKGLAFNGNVLLFHLNTHTIYQIDVNKQDNEVKEFYNLPDSTGYKISDLTIINNNVWFNAYEEMSDNSTVFCIDIDKKNTIQSPVGGSVGKVQLKFNLQKNAFVILSKNNDESFSGYSVYSLNIDNKTTRIKYEREKNITNFSFSSLRNEYAFVENTDDNEYLNIITYDLNTNQIKQEYNYSTGLANHKIKQGYLSITDRTNLWAGANLSTSVGLKAGKRYKLDMEITSGNLAEDFRVCINSYYDSFGGNVTAVEPTQGGVRYNAGTLLSDGWYKHSFEFVIDSSFYFNMSIFGGYYVLGVEPSTSAKADIYIRKLALYEEGNETPIYSDNFIDAKNKNRWKGLGNSYNNYTINGVSNTKQNVTYAASIPSTLQDLAFTNNGIIINKYGYIKLFNYDFIYSAFKDFTNIQNNNFAIGKIVTDTLAFEQLGEAKKYLDINSTILDDYVVKQKVLLDKNNWIIDTNLPESEQFKAFGYVDIKTPSISMKFFQYENEQGKVEIREDIDYIREDRVPITNEWVKVYCPFTLDQDVEDFVLAFRGHYFSNTYTHPYEIKNMEITKFKNDGNNLIKNDLDTALITSAENRIGNPYRITSSQYIIDNGFEKYLHICTSYNAGTQTHYYTGSNLAAGSYYFTCEVRKSPTLISQYVAVPGLNRNDNVLINTDHNIYAIDKQQAVAYSIAKDNNKIIFGCAEIPNDDLIAEVTTLLSKQKIQVIKERLVNGKENLVNDF